MHVALDHADGQAQACFFCGRGQLLCCGAGDLDGAFPVTSPQTPAQVAALAHDRPEGESTGIAGYESFGEQDQLGARGGRFLDQPLGLLYGGLAVEGDGSGLNGGNGERPGFSHQSISLEKKWDADLHRPKNAIIGIIAKRVVLQDLVLAGTVQQTPVGVAQLQLPGGQETSLLLQYIDEGQ